MQNKQQSWLALAALVFGLLIGGGGVAEANECDECQEQCKKGGENCKKAPGPLCKIPGVKGVCKTFKNAQCPAAEKVCRKTRCGTLPGCNSDGDPIGSNPKPGGGGRLSGDPHLYTFDRLRYDFQAVGEFLVAGTSDFEMQARLTPVSDKASIVKAAAIRFQGHVISFNADGGGMVVDDQSMQIPPDGLYVDTKLMVSTSAFGTLVTAGETNLWVWQIGSHLNLYLQPGDESAGKWVGLLGNFDGDRENEFRTRAGEAVDPETKEILYNTYGNSWRLTQEESFLPYGEGETTETFTDLEFPKEQFSISSLGVAAYAKAKKACHAKGVTEGEAFRNCIYDIGITGDTEFASSYSQNFFVDAVESLLFSGPFAMRVQATGVPGGLIPVFWSGQKDEQVRVTVTNADGKKVLDKSDGANPVKVELPSKTGTYKIELSQKKNLATQEVEVTEAKATLNAPETVPGATEFEVTWTGPLQKGDHVAFRKLGETNPSKKIAYRWAHHLKGTFQAPSTPGTYELAYILREPKDRSVLAKREIVVTKAGATLSMPGEAEAGSFIPVDWTGPDGGGDFIDIVPPGHLGFHGPTGYKWLHKGSPVQLRAPTKAGKYIIRYIANTVVGRELLATKPITITAAQATILSPESLVAGQEFELSWEAPNRSGDYLPIVDLGGTDPKVRHSYKWARKGKAKMKAPEKPGSYDILYVLSGSGERVILARKTIQVTAP